MITKGRSKIEKNQEVEVEKKEENMKTIAIVSLLCLGMFLAMGTGVVFAEGEDSEIQSSLVTLNIPHSARLDIDNANPTTTLGQDGTAETAFEAGYVEATAAYPTLRVRANKNWKLSAKSSGFSANGAYTKAIGDLQLKNAGGSHATMTSYTSLSATDQEIATAAVGVKNESHPCQYKILLVTYPHLLYHS